MSSEFLDRLSSEIDTTATEIKERTGHSDCDGWSFASEAGGRTLRCGCGLGLLADLRSLTFADGVSDIPAEWPYRIADMFGPHAGPCAFCGHHDRRHRFIDSVVGMVLAGESVEDAADDMDLDVQTVQAAVDYARSASD